MCPIRVFAFLLVYFTVFAAEARKISSTESHSTIVHYEVNGKNHNLDLKSYVGFGNVAVESMLDPETKTIYWLKNSWDTTQIMAIPQDPDGQWRLSSARYLMNFGRRNFWGSIYNSRDHSFYLSTDRDTDENFNIWRFNPRDKTLTQITHVGYLFAYTFSPRQDKIYFTSRNTEAGWKSTSCLKRISLGSSKDETLLCTQGSNFVDLYENPRVNPSETVVAVPIAINGSYNNLNLGIYDLKTKKLDLITNPKLTRERITFLGWKGDILYFTNSETGEESLYKFDLQTKKVSLIVKNEGAIFEAADLNPYNGRIFLKETGQTVNKVLIYDTKSETIVKSFEPPKFMIREIYTQPFDNGNFLFSSGSGNNFSLNIVDTSDNVSRGVLPVLNIEQQLASACETEEVFFQSFDGRQLEGIIFKPEGQATKTAALIFAHGGPQEQTSAQQWKPEIELLCHLGYYVFGVNPRGSSGFDNIWPGFSTLTDHDWGGGDFKDYVYGRRYLAQKLGIPLERIGITGESYGGFMTNWAMTQRDPQDPANNFPWGISFYGISDYLTFLKGSDVPYDIITGMGDPDSSPQISALYKERSPITYSAKLSGPLLLIHGGNDHRVPVENSRQFYRSLKSAGKGNLVTYVETKADGHSFPYMNTAVEVYQAVLNFLSKVAPLQ